MSESDFEEGEDEIMRQFQKVKSFKTNKRKKFKLPRQIAKLKAQANNLYIFGKLDEARRILEDIIKKYPDYEDAYRLYGLICQDQRDQHKAALSWMIANRQKSNNQRNWQEIAYLLLQEQNWEVAALYFGKALKSDQFNREYIFHRVECFEQIGEYHKAIKELLKIFNIEESFQLEYTQRTETFLKLTNCYIKTHQYDKALYYLNTYLQDNKNDSVISLRLQILFEQQKFIDIIFELRNQYKLKSLEDLFNYIMNQQQFKVANLFLLGLYHLELKEYNIYVKQYIFQIIEKGLVQHLLTFLKFVEENELTLSALLIREFHDFIKNKNEYSSLTKLLNKRYQTILDKNSENQQNKFEDGLEQLAILQNYTKRQDRNNSSEEEQEKNFTNYKIYNKNKIEFDENPEVFYSDEEVNFKLQKPKYQDKKELKIENQTFNFSELVTTFRREMQNTQTKDETLFIYEKLQVLVKINQPNDELFNLTKRLLQFEKNYYELRKKLVQKIIQESQKKNFKRNVKSEGFIHKIGQEYHPAMFNNKHYLNDNELLKKRKNKASEYIAVSHMKGIHCVSSVFGTKDLLLLINKICEVYFQNNMSEELFIISEEIQFNMVSARKFWRKCDKKTIDVREIQQEENQIQSESIVHNQTKPCKQNKSKEFSQYEVKMAIYGLWSSLQEKQYQYCFPFIKGLIHQNPEEECLVSYLSLVFRKSNNPQMYKTWLAKLQPKIDQLQNMKQIIANQSYNNTLYEEAIQKFQNLLDENKNVTLNKLLISLSHLQMASSRSSTDKQTLVKNSLFYFDQYRQERQMQGQQYESEILYNMGRMYVHLSLTGRAIAIFKDVLEMENLNKEIQFKSAFNLVQLYQKNGEIEDARKIMENYLILGQ